MVSKKSTFFMPITSKEKKGLAKNKIYTIYKNKYTNEIEIRSIDKKELDSLDLIYSWDSKEKGYFYKGGDELFPYAKATNRPIYDLHLTKSRRVESYTIANQTEKNGINLSYLIKKQDKILKHQEDSVEIDKSIKTKTVVKGKRKIKIYSKTF